MKRVYKKENMPRNEGIAYAEMYSKWYSWGSPIGLGLFFLFVALTAVVVRYLFIMH